MISPQSCPQDKCPLSGDVFMTDEEAQHYLTEHLGWRKVSEPERIEPLSVTFSDGRTGETIYEADAVPADGPTMTVTWDAQGNARVALSDE